MRHHIVLVQLRSICLRAAITVLFIANVLCLPPIERLFADPRLPDQLNHWNTNLGLLQHPDDLLHTESLLLHQQNPPPSPSQVLAED